MEQNSIQLGQLKEFSLDDANAIRDLTKKLGDNATLVTDEDLKKMLAGML